MLNNRNRQIAIIAVALLVMAVTMIVLTQQPSATDDNTAIVGQIAPAQYQAQFADISADHVLIDVRTPQEFNSGHIDGAINISVETLPQRLAEIPRDQAIVVYCRTGNRSATAAQILASAGYNTIYDLGGVVAWTAAGLPLE